MKFIIEIRFLVSRCAENEYTIRFILMNKNGDFCQHDSKM